MADSTIVFNHADYSYDPVKKINILYDLLIKERTTVLFVGEGNFTFTVAFAALRKYKTIENMNPKQPQWDNLNTEDPLDWKGIISTRYKPKSDDHPAPPLPEVKLTCISESIKYLLDQFRDDKMIDTCLPAANPRVIQSLVHLHSEPSPRWKYGIDACDIPHGIKPHEVMWFQCPWNGIRTHVLIEKFLLSNVGRVTPGCFVCIGIANRFPYIKNYRLEELLGEHLKAADNKTEVLEYYNFLGADDVLIKKILSFGYKHQGKSDIHKGIIDDHVTLVFQRK